MTTATKQAQRDAVFANPTAKAITHDMFSAQAARIAELEAALRAAANHVYRADAESGCIAYAQDAELVRAALAKVSP